jgi:REP element-mobilizing transposase RayT
MARRSREDKPGSWHHVTNRGVAKRPLFEDGTDARNFHALLIKQTRTKRIELHCFSLMTTHFHLLARSPRGELSEAMRLIQNEYSRTFNRRHKRDGTLIRGRFFSKPIHSIAHRFNTVRYIDANPVRAGIVRHSWEYGLGSRAAYDKDSGPSWLSRSWIESEVMRASGRSSYSRLDYDLAFGGGDAPAVQELVARRLASTATIDPLDNLIGSTPERVQRWMRRKAKLADGCEIGLPVCSRTALELSIKSMAAQMGSWTVLDGRNLRSGIELARAGMLRDLCGWSLRAIAQREGGSMGRARRLIDQHRRLLLSDRPYGAVVANVAQSAMNLSTPTGGVRGK